MGTHKEDHSNQRAFVLTLFAIIPVTIFCAFSLLKIPADQKNAFLFGLSKERLLMLVGFGILLLFDILTLLFRKKLATVLLHNDVFQRICYGLSIVSLFFLLMPNYRFHKAAAYFSRIKPYILWLFLSAALFSIMLCCTKDRFASIKSLFINLYAHKKHITVFFLIILALVLFIEISGLGKTVETSLWNKNGIPLQIIQLFCTIVIFALIRKCGVFRQMANNKRFIHFLIIWAVSAAIWSLAPKSPHFFSPGPYLPDQNYYPYSDAVTYDIAGQTALNGWGFNLKRTVLKPALVFINFLTHLVAGNNYNLSMYIQSGLFALLPAVMFLFGDAIGGIGCGYLAAAFSVMKEWNALNTHTVLTTHSRLIMSEFLMQIILASFCYAVFRWLKKEGQENYYASFAGGTVMLGIFTRYNFMAFVPAALLILFIGYRKQIRSLTKPLLFFFLTMLLTAAPMLIRDAITSSGMISELSYTIQNVLIRQRFQEKSPFEAESGVNSQNAQISEIASDSPETQKDEFNTGQITQQFSNNNSIKNLPLVPSIINHSLHNISASFLTLPMEISFQDLSHLYKQDGDGLWKDGWQGQFSSMQWFLIITWLLAGAVTLAYLVKYFGVAGFSILYFWFVYAFSIGFSRSSGGRYVVPMNWIPMLLLAVFLSILFAKGSPLVPEKDNVVSVKYKYSNKKAYCSIVCFTLFFTAMLFFENFMPAKDTAVQEEDLTVLKERLADQDRIDWETVEKQQEEGLLHITHGIVVYPRFYYFKTGEHASSGSTMGKEFSRMTFMGINKNDKNILYQEYLMPHKDAIVNFPQDSVFRAISCKSDFGYEDILAVTIETPQGEVFTYKRDPLPEFSCPVPEPVCVAVEECY